MRIILICQLLYILISCGGKGSPSYEATKITLEEQEKNDPKSFLTVNGKTWKNLIDETVVEGDITSTASVARYKDVVLVVSFDTKTDTNLGVQRYVVYEFVEPGRNTHFKIKMNAPKNTDKVRIDIESAKTAN